MIHFTFSPLQIKRFFTNLLITFIILAVITASSFYLLQITSNSACIILQYILGLVLIARYTDGYWYGIFASLISIFCVNFLFTYPYFAFNFTLSGYPITFFCMSFISLITSLTTTNLKKQTKVALEREKLLQEAEKEKLRANLLRAVSHDLRTPLTGIIGSSATYLENKERLSEAAKTDLVTNIFEDSNFLLNMVENLLSVTRISCNNATVSKALESVEEVVSEALLRFKKRVPTATVNVTVPAEVIFLPMDAVLIEQVLINLLENAVFHSKSTRPIECQVIESMKEVSFHIIDYGVGICEEEIDTIFDGTVYNDNNSNSHKGMGIGLSICKTIILAHQGTIIAKNHKEGAEFIFSLPKESD